MIDIDPRLGEFAMAMQTKIQSSDSKYGNFRTNIMEAFLEHLREEFHELNDTLVVAEALRDYSDPSRKSIAKEAIDLANMAYFVWWHATR